MIEFKYSNIQTLSKGYLDVECSQKGNYCYCHFQYIVSQKNLQTPLTQLLQTRLQFSTSSSCFHRIVPFFAFGVQLICSKLVPTLHSFHKLLKYGCTQDQQSSSWSKAMMQFSSCSPKMVALEWKKTKRTNNYQYNIFEPIIFCHFYPHNAMILQQHQPIISLIKCLQDSFGIKFLNLSIKFHL